MDIKAKKYLNNKLAMIALIAVLLLTAQVAISSVDEEDLIRSQVREIAVEYEVAKFDYFMEGKIMPKDEAIEHIKKIEEAQLKLGKHLTGDYSL